MILNDFYSNFDDFADTRAELSMNTEIYVKPGSALSLECRFDIRIFSYMSISQLIIREYIFID